MHHSDVAYWRYLQSLPPGHEDLPSPRACRLLLRMFERWKGRPGWLAEQQVGHLFRNRDDLPLSDRTALASKSVIVRKALAVQRMLEIILDPEIAASSGSSEILADELIVGTLPPFAVGQGKEFVRYLTEDEELRGALTFLNELSPMGHIIPNHKLVLDHGLDAMAADARTKADSAAGRERDFYEAVAISLEGVTAYASRHAELTRKAAEKLSPGDPRRDSLGQVAACLDVAPRGPAQSFHEALQAIYIVHCALHWTVEIVPIGRLDQLLNPYLQRDLAAGKLTLEDAQELIDCFWIKLDERVILDNRHAENRFTASDGVLTGYLGSSNYDQGGLLNQWMQQVTVGGLLPQDGPPVDACNPVTRLCLEAARRLPLNSPTLDLRVHAETPRDVLDLAARALMSGGAHPVLLNDDIIVPALAENSAAPIPLAAARNYACDGCYETMVAGESEFSFGFISALDLIEKALNRGAGLAGAGPVNLRGTKDSWRSRPAAEISSMDEFRSIMREHLMLGCHRYFTSLTSLYGNKADYAPSPLLSALISGCVEKGRDLTEGGSNYHIFSPLLVGISNAADSLYAIERLVFDEKAFTLVELTTCLATDWGHSMLTQGGRTTPVFGPDLSVARIEVIRSACLALPKFGSGTEAVDRHAWWLMQTFVACIDEARAHPMQAANIERVAERYGTAAHPFVMNIAPGVGTFEQYVGVGSWSGATPDGRRSRAPVASDLSAAPIPNDLPATCPAGDKLEHARQFSLADSMRSYRHDVMRHFGDGAPTDYVLPEDYPAEKLAETLAAFASGKSGSICTFTVADPATFAAAQADPEAYNLVRVRMGGWTEFFVALFPDHQEQHKRRPIYA